MESGELLVINLATVPQPILMRRAGEIAGALRQDLFICCLLDDAELPQPLPGRRERVRSVRQRLVARCNTSLRKLLNEMREAGITADGEVQAIRSVTNSLLELVRERSPSCVLISRGRHSRIEEATLSGNDFSIIRSCPVPVWVVNTEHSPGDKIVGAIGQPPVGEAGQNGGGVPDSRVLNAASKLARRLGKEHHALHTFGEPRLLRQAIEAAAPDPDDDMGTSGYVRRMRRVFALGAEHGLPLERIHIHEGRLLETLEEMAGPMNADLIVMGARSHGRFARLFSGNAANVSCNA
jgi:universal stress protein E